MVSLIDIYNIKESTFSELKKDRDPARGNKGKSDEKDYLCLKPNHSTLQCILTLKKIWLDFRGDKGSLRTVLGFDQKIYKDDGGGRHVSEHIVNIHRVNTVLVHCDVVNLSRRRFHLR